jgi:hypothetical protein
LVPEVGIEPTHAAGVGISLVTAPKRIDLAVRLLSAHLPQSGRKSPFVTRNRSPNSLIFFQCPAVIEQVRA